MRVLKHINVPDGRKRYCDARCYNARTSKCTCVCAGMNHGVGLRQARANTRLFLDCCVFLAQLEKSHEELSASEKGENNAP